MFGQRAAERHSHARQPVADRLLGRLDFVLDECCEGAGAVDRAKDACGDAALLVEHEGGGDGVGGDLARVRELHLSFVGVDGGRVGDVEAAFERLGCGGLVSNVYADELYVAVGEAVVDRVEVFRFGAAGRAAGVLEVHNDDPSGEIGGSQRGTVAGGDVESDWLGSPGRRHLGDGAVAGDVVLRGAGPCAARRGRCCRCPCSRSCSGLLLLRPQPVSIVVRRVRCGVLRRASGVPPLECIPDRGVQVVVAGELDELAVDEEGWCA